MGREKCVINIINSKAGQSAEVAELPPEVKKVADAFYKRNGEALKNAALNLHPERSK